MSLPTESGEYQDKTKCAHCNTWIRDDCMYPQGGNEYCQDCYCELFGTCESCGDVYEHENLNYVQDCSESICDNCIDGSTYWYCLECEILFSEYTDIYHDADDDIYCKDCGLNLEVISVCGSCKTPQCEYMNTPVCDKCSDILKFLPFAYLEPHSSAQISILEFIETIPYRPFLINKPFTYKTALKVSWLKVIKPVPATNLKSPKYTDP